MTPETSCDSAHKGVLREDEAAAAESSVRLTTRLEADGSVPIVRNGSLNPSRLAPRLRGAQGCDSGVRPANDSTPAAPLRRSPARAWARRVAPWAALAVAAVVFVHTASGPAHAFA